MSSEIYRQLPVYDIWVSHRSDTARLRLRFSNTQKLSAIIHAKNNIRMNCVLPGLMHTAMLERMADKYADGVDYEGFVDKRNNQVPMGCMGTADDVANRDPISRLR